MPYNTDYKKTLEEFTNIKSKLVKEDFNKLLNKFTIHYQYDTSSEQYNRYNFYTTINNKYVILSPFSTIIQFKGVLKMFKTIGFNKLIVDVKNFNKSDFNIHFIGKENIDKIIVSQKNYTSTNNSKMSIIELDLTKVKLEDLKEN